MRDGLSAVSASRSCAKPVAFAGEVSRQWFWTLRVLNASLHRPYRRALGCRTALCQWASRLTGASGGRDAGLRRPARRRRGKSDFVNSQSGCPDPGALSLSAMPFTDRVPARVCSGFISRGPAGRLLQIAANCVDGLSESTIGRDLNSFAESNFNAWKSGDLVPIT